jgi:hypothetical protein
MWKLGAEATYLLKQACAHNHARLAHAVLGKVTPTFEPFASLPDAPGWLCDSYPPRLIVAMELFYPAIDDSYFRMSIEQVTGSPQGAPGKHVIGV